MVWWGLSCRGEETEITNSRIPQWISNVLDMQTRLFVDESYGEDHYYVSGVLVNEKVNAELTGKLNALGAGIAEKFNLSSSPEFHAHEMMSARGDWKFLKNDVPTRIAILRKTVIEIVNSGPQIIIEGVDVERLNARYRYPDPPYEIALRHMLERVNDRCSRHGNECLVEADMISRSQDFREAIEGYTRSGTPGYRPSKLGNIEQPIDFVDSRSSRGIQAADISVYLTRRVNENHLGSKQAMRSAKRMKSILDQAVWHQRKWIP